MSSGCFNALLMPQEPIEAGTDYTEKEVNKLFTTQRGCSVSLYRLEGNESTGHWAADGKGSLELPRSVSRNVCGASITGNHVSCHYQLLSETDAPRSILVSNIKELLWRYTDFWTKANNKTILNYYDCQKSPDFLFSALFLFFLSEAVDSSPLKELKVLSAQSNFDHYWSN